MPSLEKKQLTLPNFKLAFVIEKSPAALGHQWELFLCQVGRKNRSLPEEIIWVNNVLESYKAFSSDQHREEGHGC